jgi:AcrR family transcriptional regulator
MPRPRSDEKRRAILEAATRIIVTQGLGAPTAGIAKEAGVANGSLFTYFETKTDLFNELYLELKGEMAAAALKGVPEGADLRTRLLHVWRNWTNFAVSAPEKRRALAQLGVSDEITPQTRASTQKMMVPLGELLEQCRANGPMRTVPMGFLGTLMNALAESTMDFMTHDPANAKKHCRTGFDALWRMIS